jgi:hypothetical protein
MRRTEQLARGLGVTTRGAVGTSTVLLSGRGGGAARPLYSPAGPIGSRRGFAAAAAGPKVVEVYTTAWCPFWYTPSPLLLLEDVCLWGVRGVN